MIRIEDHLEWAAGIARGVARNSGLRGSGVDDLIATAQLKLCEQLERFDPTLCPEGGSLNDLFRGWSRRNILTECIDEVKRMRAGGLIRRRVRNAFTVPLLGDQGPSLADETEEIDLDRPESSRRAVAPRTTAMTNYGRRLARGTGP